ncbi:metalloregulator ArsR/SmtB family transcription factor [Synechococcales cyanobacterium C]|uniref:Metalloregulator ArsR/SmtB family transcription factor n=1 Tax=Petrachloros mirabilis ULC683 TaxID=2781853 RepID=A0A8K1ZVI4_9CYAN|nr:metalloregulator ArsR/SmtB family transcription factor [Petrachloros mirabilis ULC683]
MIPSAYAPSANIANGFHALSEPLRIKILEILRQQECCVAQLCSALDISQSKLSFHLKVLKDAELVHARHEGRWIHYSLNLPRFALLQDYLAQYHDFSHRKTESYQHQSA